MRVNKRYLWNYPKKIFRMLTLKKIAPYTKLSFEALSQVWDAVDQLEQEKVWGSLVETGCWNGGCGALMAWRAKVNGSARRVWLFDSFEGLPEATSKDRQWTSKTHGAGTLRREEASTFSGKYRAEERLVQEALAKLGVAENVVVVKGWFNTTLPATRATIGPIALLRLDGDLYESTKESLEYLYDLVAPSGIVIIDDFNLQGCRQALFEFLAKQKSYPFIVNNLFAGRGWFRKPI